jgi:hypothetical protein
MTGGVKTAQPIDTPAMKIADQVDGRPGDLCAISQVPLLASIDRTSPRPRGAPRRARTTSRVQAALTALAFVLASLFGVLHEATTIHVRCTEHGELIHRDATVANTASADRDAVVRDMRVETKPSHEHCSLTSSTRESRLVPRPPAIVSIPMASSRLALIGPRTTPTRGGGLYRTAPKTSPPASHGDA